MIKEQSIKRILKIHVWLVTGVDSKKDIRFLDICNASCFSILSRTRVVKT